MDEKNATRASLVAQMNAKYGGRVVEDSRSPAGNWLGLTLEKAARGEVIITVPVKPEMTNPYGNIHGGMMALVMDEVIGWAVVSLEAETHYTSLSLNVDFLYAIKGGDTLRAAARVIREGKKIVHIECAVTNAATGVLLAKGTSNLIATSMSVK